MTARRAVIAVDVDLPNDLTAEEVARSLRMMVAAWGYLNPEVVVLDPGEQQ